MVSEDLPEFLAKLSLPELPQPGEAKVMGVPSSPAPPPAANHNPANSVAARLRKKKEAADALKAAGGAVDAKGKSGAEKSKNSPEKKDGVDGQGVCEENEDEGGDAQGGGADKKKKKKKKSKGKKSGAVGEVEETAEGNTSAEEDVVRGGQQSSGSAMSMSSSTLGIVVGVAVIALVSVWFTMRKARAA
jgi:hypothetical protein